MATIFKLEQLGCPCGCGTNLFKVDTLAKLNKLCTMVGGKVVLSSAFRCEKYNRAKGYTQTHASGQAADISCTHEQAFEVLEAAFHAGFTGIGVSQKGEGRFIHVDDLPKAPGRPRPHVWSY